MTFKTPVLPKITWLELFGYAPLFDEVISVAIDRNRLLVLGGNGLGKTTILQSVIYCIAGEADSDVEQHKDKMWGRKYFYGRIKKPEHAYVKVEFYLGQDKILLKRGFSTAKILEFSLNDELIDSSSAEKDFESYLKDVMGYQSSDDFRFLVHILCYLSEDRSNLVWDSENQVRLMMLLFNDIIKELEFREGRKQLKKLDSQKRHISVDLNAARANLIEKNAASDLNKNSSHKDKIQENTLEEKMPVEIHDDELIILKQLYNISEKKASFQNTIKELRKELTVLAEEVELLRGNLSEKEEEFILGRLDEIQSNEVKLALHKLLHRQICPACGEKAEELADRAKKFQDKSSCPLCGSKHSISKLNPDNNSFRVLEKQLSEKAEKKFSLEQSLIENEKRIQDLEEKENILQFQYSKIEFNINRPAFLVDNPISPEEHFEIKVKELELRHLQVERRFQQLKTKLEKKYSEYSNIVHERIVRLGQLYQSYATSFLGVPCELSRRDADVKFLSLDLYVPKFNDQIRMEPESCSEAQRFFLDIAFRMSVIDLSRELSGFAGSFVCETPESALDITYIENVAKMFVNFSKEGHSLIASGNLQPAGLAGPILFDIPREIRYKCVLNLLDYGKLSNVQEANRSSLRSMYHEQVIEFNGF